MYAFNDRCVVKSNGHIVCKLQCHKNRAYFNEILNKFLKNVEIRLKETDDTHSQ